MFAVFPAPYVAGAAGVTSLAFHDDAYSSTDQITVPATAQAGDVIFLSQFALSKGGAPSLVTPSGFTGWINIAGGFARLAVSYKLATGSETTLTGMNGDFTDDKILAVFRPDVPATSITASSPTSEVTSGNPSSQSIVATNGTLPLLAFGIYANGTIDPVNPRTMTPDATAELNSGVNYHFIKYQEQNVSLANVTIDMNDNGEDNMLAGGYLWVA